MDVLDYLERESRLTFAEAVRAYTDTHERAYRLATVLLAGAGTVAVMAINALAGDKPAWQVLATATLAAFWFAVAGVLMWRGMHSYTLSNGATPASMLEVYDDQPGAWDAVCIPTFTDGRPGEYPGGPLVALRRQQLQQMDKRTMAYMAAQHDRTRWLDWVYRQLALTPLAIAVPAGALWLASLF